MVDGEATTTNIRSAREGDVPAIQQLFKLCYGERYSHPEFVSAAYLRKMMYSDNSIVLVAEEADDGVVATA